MAPILGDAPQSRPRHSPTATHLDRRLRQSPVAIHLDRRLRQSPAFGRFCMMLEHGVRTIWTHDRDFRRFRDIDVRDPLD
jgi:hypothetical protein